MPVIFASGYSNEMLLDEQLLLDPMRGFLPKPYDRTSLREAITRMPACPHARGARPVDISDIVRSPRVGAFYCAGVAVACRRKTATRRSRERRLSAASAG